MTTPPASRTRFVLEMIVLSLLWSAGSTALGYATSRATGNDLFSVLLTAWWAGAIGFFVNLLVLLHRRSVRQFDQMLEQDKENERKSKENPKIFTY